MRNNRFETIRKTWQTRYLADSDPVVIVVTRDDAFRRSTMTPQMPLSYPHPWRFLLVAVAASWSVWAAGLIPAIAVHHSLAIATQMGGSLAVGAAAVFMIYQSRDRCLVHNFWRGIVDTRRMNVFGWAAAVLLMPALGYAAALLDAFSTGHAPKLGAIFQSGLQPMLLVKTFGFGLLVGPFFEETGWRGVALAPLQTRYGALAGAMALGCMHALWHLPLFVLPNGYYHAMGVLTPAFCWFMIDIVVFDLLVASLFNYTRASVLAAILFHGSFNAVGALWDLSPTATWYRSVLTAVLAALIVLATRGRLFRRTD
jgi:uncharacterized protein